jgi:hypothetical protein
LANADTSVTPIPILALTVTNVLADKAEAAVADEAVAVVAAVAAVAVAGLMTALTAAFFTLAVWQTKCRSSMVFTPSLVLMSRTRHEPSPTMKWIDLAARDSVTSLTNDAPSKNRAVLPPLAPIPAMT